MLVRQRLLCLNREAAVEKAEDRFSVWIRVVRRIVHSVGNSDHLFALARQSIQDSACVRGRCRQVALSRDNQDRALDP